MVVESAWAGVPALPVAEQPQVVADGEPEAGIVRTGDSWASCFGR